MAELPDGLIRRLPLPEAHALRRVLSVIREELPLVYAENKRDYRPRDNALIFGQRVSVHLWAALEERGADLGDARIQTANNAHFVKVGTLTLAIHKLGSHRGDDIHSHFPEGSPTQRAYGERNANQLTLFECAPEAPLPEERAFALRDLVVGHFGNHEDELVKWYVGAFAYDDQRRPRWAWVTAQPVSAALPAPDVVPYHEREPAAVEVKPRARLSTDQSADGRPGA
jgi:hypothetical protein